MATEPSANSVFASLPGTDWLKTWGEAPAKTFAEG